MKIIQITTPSVSSNIEVVLRSSRIKSPNHIKPRTISGTSVTLTTVLSNLFRSDESFFGEDDFKFYFLCRKIFHDSGKNFPLIQNST